MYYSPVGWLIWSKLVKSHTGACESARLVCFWAHTYREWKHVSAPFVETQGALHGWPWWLIQEITGNWGEESLRLVFLLSLVEGEGLCKEKVSTVIRCGIWAWALPWWKPILQSLEAKKMLAPEVEQAQQAAGSRGKPIQALSLF